MKKILILFTLLFSAPNLFGAYKIKIAVYKDRANLMTYVAHISEKSYRNSIHIEKKNHLHYVSSALYESENEANKALRAYKKVFTDAFIVEVEKKIIVPVVTKSATHTPAPIMLVSVEVEEVNKTLAPVEEVVQTTQPVENEQIKVEKKIIVPVDTEEVAQAPVPEEEVNQTFVPAEVVAQVPEQIPALDAKILLENKTVYICNEGVSPGTKNEVVQMDFKKDYVVYSKLKRDIPPIDIAYTFDQDCVMLPMSGVNFKYKIYQESKDFLSAQSFINGKKAHTLRYYFDESAALEFAAKY